MINDKIMKISYKIKFIDRFRFISSSLSSLVNNLSEGLHSDKCTDSKSSLDYIATKDKQLIFRWFECKKNYKKDFNKELIKRFANIYEFRNEDINKFILLLRKGVYPYEYMDGWEIFNETSLPDKEAFYSSLNLEDITSMQKEYSKALTIKILVISMICIFKVIHYCLHMRNICIKVYELDPAHFLSSPGLAWQTCLKKTEVKLELLTDVDILLKVEKGIRGGICHAILRYAKANNKYMRDYNKDEEESFLLCNDANNLYGFAVI